MFQCHTYFLCDSLKKIAMAYYRDIVHVFVSLSADSVIGVYGLVVFSCFTIALFKLKMGFDYIDLGVESKRSIIDSIFPKSIFGHQSTKKDVQIFFLNRLLLVLFAIYFFDFSSAYFHDWSKTQTVGWLNLGFGKMIVPFSNGLMIDFIYTLSLIAAYSTGHTIRHYLMHRIRFLWEIHKVHHSAPVLSIFTSTRLHIIEIILNVIATGTAMGCTSGIFLYFFYTLPSVITILGGSIFFFFLGVTAVFGHSHVWWSWGKLDYIFYSPAMHIIHHSVKPEHHHRNFGIFFSFPDMLLGTFYKAAKRPENIEVGLKDTFNWETASLWQLYSYPIKKSFSVLFGLK